MFDKLLQQLDFLMEKVHLHTYHLLTLRKKINEWLWILTIEGKKKAVMITKDFKVGLYNLKVSNIFYFSVSDKTHLSYIILLSEL